MASSKNNEILAMTRKALGDNKYRHAAKIMNNYGEKAALHYLQTFFRRPAREALALLAERADACRARKPATTGDSQ